ncbi:MAG: cupin domain-containing protein [bacterium]|nr:cupin domain-containing protein [bacterium]MDZ4285134.1 cupin domain-containing protein [Patescibacteria group bacterium]
MELPKELYDIFYVTQFTRGTALARVVGVDRVRVEPMQRSQTHRHLIAETILYIESGSGTVVVDANDHAVKAGDRICIPKGAYHHVCTDASELVFTSIQHPPIHDDETGWHDLELRP